MRGRVVARERVLGQKEADEENVNGCAGEAETGVVDEVGEDERGRLVVRRDEEEGAHDDDDADQVPPDRDVVEDGHQTDAESVEQAVGEEDDRIDRNDVWRVQRVVEELVEQGRHEEGSAEVDAGGDTDLAEQVEPACEPARSEEHTSELQSRSDLV